MSRFDINKTQRSPEEWSAIAFKQTTENNIQWNIALGLVVAAIAASATTPITGLLIAGWAIFDSISKAKEIQRNQAAIREEGAVAHVLEGDDFRKYLHQVGSEAVEAELSFAAEQNLSFSNAALDYAENRGISTETGGTPSFGFATPVRTTGSHWLDLKEVPSKTQFEKHVSLPSATTQSSVHETSNIFDIVKAIASPIQNCIILGVGGSGKGIVVSNALRHIKANFPNRKIFYIDPKNEEGEYGYLDGVADIVKRKTCKNKSAEEICEWLDEVLDEYIEWENQNEETLLVADEGMVIGDACKKTKNTRIGTIILHIASLGGAGKHNVYLITQTPYVGSMGMNLSQSSQMKWVTLIGANDMGVLKQWSKSANLESISLDRLGALTQESPVKRAVYWGGHSKWYALPQYPNYSAIDRDNNKPAGDALSTEQRQALRDKTNGSASERAKSPTEIMIDKLERTRCKTLEDFIVQELNQGDRLDELTEAIICAIRDTNHWGLKHKFKLD